MNKTKQRKEQAYLAGYHLGRNNKVSCFNDKLYLGVITAKSFKKGIADGILAKKLKNQHPHKQNIPLVVACVGFVIGLIIVLGAAA